MTAAIDQPDVDSVVRNMDGGGPKTFPTANRLLVKSYSPYYDDGLSRRKHRKHFIRALVTRVIMVHERYRSAAARSPAGFSTRLKRPGTRVRGIVICNAPTASAKIQLAADTAAYIVGASVKRR